MQYDMAAVAAATTILPIAKAGSQALLQPLLVLADACRTAARGRAELDHITPAQFHSIITGRAVKVVSTHNLQYDSPGCCVSTPTIMA